MCYSGDIQRTTRKVTRHTSLKAEQMHDEFLLIKTLLLKVICFFTTQTIMHKSIIQLKIWHCVPLL